MKQHARIHGFHSIADLYGCNFSYFQSNSKRMIKKKISGIIAQHTLRELGSFYHFFSGTDSFTCVIALAESHVSIHTWPEDGYVSVDVFVCNYSMNQKDNAKKVFQDILQLFSPKIKKQRFLSR